MAYKKIPPVSSAAHKLCKYIYEECGITEAECVKYLVDSGITMNSARVVFRGMVEAAQLIQRNDLFDLCIRFKDYFNGCKPECKDESPRSVAAPRDPPPFKPLNQSYISAMQRAMRLDDGHEPMRFVGFSGIANVYREFGND